ncbi:MAG: tetratricopeptide repeat protein [Calditrichaeota bacterium]|nr:MAG: tetratricopeptide repeat protein [Calditrichota bacterium]
MQKFILFILLTFTTQLAFSQSHYEKAAKHFENAKYHLAIEEAEKGIKSGDQNPELLHLKLVAESYQLFAQNNLVEAKKSFEKSVEKFPTSFFGNYGLGLVCSEMLIHTEAIPALKKAFELNSQNPEVTYNLANVYRSLGDNANAQKWFKKTLEINPNFAQANLGLGILDYRKGNFAEAEKFYRKALGKNSEIPKLHFRLGQTLLKQEKIPEAIAEITKEIELFPETLEAYNLLGKAYIKAGEIRGADRAFKLFKKLQPLQDRLNLFTLALKVSPNNPQNHANLAKFYYNAYNNKKAEESYKKTIELDSNFSEAHLGLGMVLFEEKKNLEAIKSFLKTIELNPNDSRAYVYLASVYFETNTNLDEAKSLTEKAIQLEPTAPAFDTLGLIYLKLGDKVKARENFQKAINLAPTNKAYQQHLGMTISKEQ